MSNKLKLSLLLATLVGTGLGITFGMKSHNQKLAQQACYDSVEMICIKAYDCGGFGQLSDCFESVSELNLCTGELASEETYTQCLDDLKLLRCTDQFPPRCDYLIP